MQAKDLRIGNIIASGKKFSELSSIGKVLEIGNLDREFEQIYCECDESFEWFFKDNYCGIPLTEEWLIMFGFTKKIDSESLTIYWIGHNKLTHDWLFEVKNIDGYPFFYRNGTHAIHYVNQLQNLYHALTGEELTIKE